MSYRRPDTGNSMNDYFTALTDFYAVAPKILNARTDQEFDAWLDKMAQIDIRSTVLYLDENLKYIPGKYRSRIKMRLGRLWEDRKNLDKR